MSSRSSPKSNPPAIVSACSGSAFGLRELADHQKSRACAIAGCSRWQHLQESLTLSLACQLIAKSGPIATIDAFAPTQRSYATNRRIASLPLSLSVPTNAW